jgi:hypothetical protein
VSYAFGHRTVLLVATLPEFDLLASPLSNGNQITLPSNGSVMKTTFNADGTRTVQATGNNVVILFPTDTPAGPSTKLYTGRIVYTVAPAKSLYYAKQ